ncbi:hypothetical protein PRUPE_8G136300 [Prunus persica]|uniref:Plant basic secretory protein (BSP) family protein n=1 Tax=Prunus persica TaxID=3760 RepID=A0A251MXJ3_PRUPE|nr:uncharacterized protein LOC18766288 [Prunus persica]ONH91773.1 hypothetical protein PRUPE_8G136300 [Prunus persica]
MVRSIYVLCFITLAAGLVHGAYDMEYFVNDVTVGIHNQDRFEQEIGVNYCMKTLISATEFIWDLFQQSTPEDRKSVHNITLTIEDMKGEAYTNTSNNEIHVSAGYILSYPAADAEGQRNEMNGVIYHQLTHVWQWNGNGQAPRGLVEGIADYVRMKSGFIPSQWAQPGVGDRWDQGYDVTARFLEYLESLRNGFVTELNKKMRLGYSDDDFVQLLGKNVGQLWTEYKLRYAKR